MTFRKTGIYLLLSLFLSEFVCSQDREISTKQDAVKSQYFCPPCGCTGDHLIFDHPGSCDHCSMDLMSLGTGFKRTARLAAKPVFQNARSYARYYVRIIYPLIIFELLFAIFLFTKVGKSKRFLFFSLFIFSLSLYMLKFQLYGTQYALIASRISYFIPISFLLWVWPALFLFLRSGIEIKKIDLRENVAHFIPGIISFILQLFLLLTYPDSERFLYNHFDSYINLVEQILFVLGGFYYGRKIYLLETKVKTTNRLIHKKLLVFVGFVFVASLTLGMMLLLNITLYHGMVATLDYHLVWFLFAAFIPWFCFEAWKNREDFMMVKSKSFRLSEEKVDSLKIRFDEILKDHEVLGDPKLGLFDMAQMLGISPREMTEFIGRAYNSNFYDVISSSRVEIAKSKLLLSEFDHFTNEAIGQLCGFGSKTTFIKSFKKATGLTPGQFKESQNTRLSTK